MSNEAKVESVEVLGSDNNALERIEKATVDVQIATAHQYPRSMTLFKKRAMEMVTLDEETAQSCLYRRPVGKDQSGRVEYAEGKSIRMAEIVGACYGNLRVGAIIVEMTPRYVKARGMAHDLESNFAASSEVVEATVDRRGQPYSERMRVVVAKACLSKARRDATFQVVPGALCKAMEAAARETAIGTVATLGKRRINVMDWINKAGIEKERVFASLGITGVDDIGMDELEKLTGIRTAIKDGDITIEEAFPVVTGTDADKKPSTSIRERATATDDKPTEAKEEPAAEQQPSLDEQIKPLYDALPAKKVHAAAKAAGIKMEDGEDWEGASVSNKTAFLSLLKAAK